MKRRSLPRLTPASMREALARLVGTLRPRRRDDDLEAELRFHAEMAAEAASHDRSEAGAPTPARFAVGSSQAMDALRDQRHWPGLAELARDLRLAARGLCRTPGFTLAALLTLGVGIGGATAVFSVVKAVLLDPLTYPASDRLVSLALKAPGAPGVAEVSGSLQLSPSMYFTFADHNRVFEHVGVWATDRSTLTGSGDPEQVRALDVSDGTLDALGVGPMLGRSLDSADQAPRTSPVILLGYGLWQRRFGGAPDVVGRQVRIDDVPAEIVGVMPRGFNVADFAPDIIVPAQFDRADMVLPGFGYHGVARLRPGVDLAAADADIARMIPIWMDSWRMTGGLSPHVYDVWRITPALLPLKQDVVGGAAAALWIVMGTVGLLLLIACANVAGLLMVRADARQPELAVRAALGAGRARLVLALFAESLLLGAAGGALGLGLADIGLRVLVALHPPTLPRLAEIAIDGRVLTFAVVVSLVSSVLFGVLPSWRATGLRGAARLAGGLRGSIGSRERRRLRDVLVGSQVALAVVLLVGSGLMVRTMRALDDVDPGFSTSAPIETVQTTIPGALVPTGPRVLQLQHDIVDRLAAVPDVAAVAFANAVPLDDQARDWDDLMPEGRVYKPGEMPGFRLFKWVSPGYFAAVGTPIIAGRDYDWTDLAERRRVTIVSANLARELWGSAASAIGRRVRTLETSPWREVIGVAADARDNGMDQPAPATVYWPAYTESLYRANAVADLHSFTLFLRTDRAGTPGLLDDIRRALRSANPELPIASVRTIANIYDASFARRAFTLTMLTAAAIIGVLLGIVGLYGVVSSAGAQRRREVGIRVALGADRGSVTRLFLRQGLRIAAAGIAIGLPIAVVASRLIHTLLFRTGTVDPPTYAAVAIAIGLAAAAASYVPARRAAAVDPVRALRE